MHWEENSLVLSFSGHELVNCIVPLSAGRERLLFTTVCFLVRCEALNYALPGLTLQKMRAMWYSGVCTPEDRRASRWALTCLLLSE